MSILNFKIKYDFKTLLNGLYFDSYRSTRRDKTIMPQLSRLEVLSNVDAIIRAKENMTRAIVITPTTGPPLLVEAVRSVMDQDYMDLKHLIVIDGIKHLDKTVQILEYLKSDKFQILTLHENTGQNGMNGHRIYAAVPFLINAEYIFFLDQDNWLDSNHVSSMINTMEKENLDWSYSMRKVFQENGEFVTNDNCESLGDYQCYSRLPNLVDTNCYGFKRSTLVKSAHYWYHPLRADRYFFHHLKEASPKYKSTGLYSVNYRLTDNRPPSPEFFLAGNQFMEDKYRGKFPWVL